MIAIFVGCFMILLIIIILTMTILFTGNKEMESTDDDPLVDDDEMTSDMETMSTITGDISDMTIHGNPVYAYDTLVDCDFEEQEQEMYAQCTRFSLSD